MKLNFFQKFFKMDTSAKTVKNLPDLVRKINKNEITKYHQVHEEQMEIKEKDQLYMRLVKKDWDYIEEIKHERTMRKKFVLYLKFILAKYFSNENFKICRFEKIISRPNEKLRIPHFHILNQNFKRPESNFKDRKYGYFSVFITFLMGLYFSLAAGYYYSRLKYDIYTRKYMYIHYTSFILFFEFIDYHAMEILDKLDYYFPKYISDKEAEYIAFRKMQAIFKKRKINKSVNMILETDPDFLELDELLKKINK